MDIKYSDSKVLDFYQMAADAKVYYNYNFTKSYKVPWESWGEDYKLIHGELTIISGISGNGKSDVVIQLGLGAISQGAKLFIASLELPTGELYKRVVTCSTGISHPTDEFIEAIGMHYHNKLWVYNETGLPNMDHLIEEAEFAAHEWGFDIFVFDNLMMLTEKEDDYNEQKKIVKRLSKFAKDKNVIVLLVAHSKKPQTTKLLNNNERTFFLPSQADIKGCSSIGQLADNHFSVSINSEKLIALQKKRNGANLSDSDLNELKKGCSIIRRDKKRNHGEFFTRYLFFDKRFSRLKDYETQIPKPYFEYSAVNIKKD